MFPWIYPVQDKFVLIVFDCLKCGALICSRICFPFSDRNSDSPQLKTLIDFRHLIPCESMESIELREYVLCVRTRK